MMGSEWIIVRNQEEGNRDSIWLGWKHANWSATILFVHDQYIHAHVNNIGGYTFDLTVAYGEGTAVKRRPLWNGINTIRSISDNRDWLLIGDFNEIRNPTERDGHGTFDRAGADEFVTAIVGFTELEAIGGRFTCSNRVGSQHTRSRFDRALGNACWITRWTQTKPKLILGTSSDHATLHLQLTRLEKGSTPFKFYNSCLREEGFNREFKTAWSNGSPLYKIQLK